MKNVLNSQDSKTLARLVKTYGTPVILSELGKSGTKEVSAYARNKAELLAEQVKPALESAISSMERLAKSKLLGGLAILKTKVASVSKETAKAAPKKKRSAR